MSVFTSWPPDLTTEQLEQLTLLATTYALSHSLLYLPPHSPDKRPPPAPESAIHAPVSLIPAPIPRRIFTQSLNLQSVYNTLYARVVLDISFLDQVMGPGGVSDVDDFTFSLWSAWKKLRDEGVPPVRRTPSVCSMLTDRPTSHSISACFALTTCYTNQHPTGRYRSNRWNLIPSHPRLGASHSELPGCIGVWSCQCLLGVTWMTFI